MRIIYRNQLPGKPPTEKRFGGLIGSIIAFLIGLGFIVVLIILIPFAIFGVLMFFSFVVIMMIAGWVYLGFKLGFRDLWEVTKLAFGIGSRGKSGESRFERLSRIWEERIKGRDGQWVK